MSPELKAKWIESIRTLPLHREGGYFAPAETMYSTYEQQRNPTCPACALGRLYQVLCEKDTATTENVRRLHGMAIVLRCEGGSDVFGDIIAINDNLDTPEDEAKAKIIAIIEKEF